MPPIHPIILIGLIGGTAVGLQNPPPGGLMRRPGVMESCLTPRMGAAGYMTTIAAGQLPVGAFLDLSLRPGRMDESVRSGPRFGVAPLVMIDVR